MSFSKYPKYKASGVEWLGDVPEGWDVGRLKRVCHVFPSNVDKKSYDGETQVLLCNYTDVYYHDTIVAGSDFMAATATTAQIAQFTLRAGDTIITKDSETADDIAIAAYVPADLPGVICGYHLSMIRPTRAAHGAFVKRLFDSTYVKSCVAVRANGLTRVGLGQYEIDNLDLPFPPLSEQLAIAAFLDRETAKIDELVNAQARLIELLKEKRQAVISNAVTKGLNPHAPMKPSGVEWLGDVPEHWEVVRLRWLCEIKKRIAGQLGYDVLSITQQGLRVRDITSNDGQLSMDYSKYQMVEIGDFAMNHMDLLTGYVDLASMRGVTSPDYRVFSIRDATACRSSYILFLFQMGYRNRIFYAYGQGSSQLGRWRMPTEAFKDLSFPLPPLPEQLAIAAFLDRETARIDTLTAEAQRAIDLLQERRSALISAAVTGQIDIRNTIPMEAA